MRSLTPFGTLRSWMNQPSLSESDTEALWQAISTCAREQPELYQAQWKPYLRGFAYHFLKPVVILESLEELGEALTWLPWAWFGLNLHEQRLGEEGARALAGSPHLAKLTELDLGENRIGDEGARALAGSPHLAKLTTLHLEGNQIGDEGARGSPHLAKLTTLHLWFNQLGEEGASGQADCAPFGGQPDRASLGRGSEGAGGVASPGQADDASLVPQSDRR